MTPEEEAAQESAAAAEAEKAAQAGETQDLEHKDEGEPGGDSPEQIRARKEYRARKKAEAALQVERERAIALEARVQTLQEVATRKVEQAPVTEQKRFTSTEAWQKVDNGEWSREQATEYIADSRYIENRERERTQERAIKEVVEPVQKAKNEALEYVALVPGLRDKSHPKWGEIESAVKYFLTEGGIKHINLAEKLALREVLGPIEEVREKQRVSQARASGDHHMETQSGSGAGGFKGSSDGKFKDIPDHIKDLWERSNVSDKDREIEAKYFRENRDRYAKRK